MFRRYVLPVLALALLAFAVYHVLAGQQKQPLAKPPIEPPRTPFKTTVAGAGMVEARTENISVGSPVSGVVAEVLVRVGQQVKVGAPLFRLDDRHLQADLKVRQASLEAAQAQYDWLSAKPRPEEVPVNEAKVREAKAQVQDQRDQFERARRLARTLAIAQEELNRREQAYRVAQEQLARAEAELALLRAGTWEPEKAASRAALVQAEAQVDQIKTELDRLVIRALVEGEVLQINVRPGEFVGAPPDQTLILLGDVSKLHVRVDIDEHDIPRFVPHGPARAVLRGDRQQEFPLMFVHVEPFVVPKKSLTGDNTERVDTRVLQVIYQIETGPRRLYVGQLLDVFIDGSVPSSSESLERVDARKDGE